MMRFGDDKMIIYYGQVGWGWKMYGIGYKTKWFFGFSMKWEPPKVEEWDIAEIMAREG